MPWFRVSASLFLGWAILFALFPHFTNDLAAIEYVPSKHADDWTQIVGVLCFGLAVLLDQAHRSESAVARRTAARGVLAFSLPCIILMSYWQLIPDRRWTRFDIGNIALLGLISLVLVPAARGEMHGKRNGTEEPQEPVRKPA